MCKYITIFSIVDEFCISYEEWVSHKLINLNKQKIRKGKLTLSESISIMIFYHFSPYKNFKTYYQHFIVSGNLFKNPPYHEILELTGIKPLLV